MDAADLTVLHVPDNYSAEEAAELRAAHGLVTTTRRLMRAVATTDVAVDDMEAAERALASVAESLEQRRGRRHRRIPFDSAGIARVQDGQPWEHFSFNPLGIPLVMYLHGTRARATLDLDALHEGPPELLHGGFSAGLMDALLGSLVQAQGVRSVTAKLELRFRRAVPLDTKVVLGGEVVESEGRKTWAEGWIEHDGARAVEARGLFVRMPGEPD